MPVDAELAKRLTRVARGQRTSTAERNRLIREAHAAGGGMREIARLVEMSLSAVQNILVGEDP